MVRTHEAIIIRDDNPDLIRLSKLACAEVKKKRQLPHEVWLKPVWHTVSPFGHVVIVELPTENGREKDAGKPLEVQRRKMK